MGSARAADPDLTADAAELDIFVDALFRHAAEGGHVSLRAFRDDGADGPPVGIETVLLNGAGTAPVISRAEIMATDAARRAVPAVFAPPIATFRDGTNAKSANLAEGLALSVELDESPAAARDRLEDLLGPATVVVASGGEFIDPKTGEIEARLHVHWRLARPTRTPEEHGRLREARRLATKISGGDATNISIVHPIRWPGSWHRKKCPRLARIVESDSAREIDLDGALDLLRKATGEPARPAGNLAHAAMPSRQRADDDLDVCSALAAIPNADLDWDNWNRIGMAAWAASGGSAAGLSAFHAWSAKSEKYDATATTARWRHFETSPPTEIGAGTLYHLAAEAAPGWTRPSLWRIRQREQGKEETPRLRLTDWTSAIYRGEPAPIRWLIEGAIPLGVPGMVAAMGDTGKSMALLDLCRQVAFGPAPVQPPTFGGTVAQEGTAVFITTEDGKDDVHRRLAALDPKGDRFGPNGRRLIVVPLPAAGGPMTLFAEDRKHGLIATEAWHDLVAQLRDLDGLRLVVLDPLQAFVAAAINEDPAAGQFVCSHLSTLAAETGATVLVAHHMRKPARPVTSLSEARDAIRGTTALVDGLRLAFALWPLDETEARKTAKEIGIDFAHNRIVRGGVVKANGPARREVRTYARDDRGLLCDVTLRAARGHNSEEARASLVESIADAARDGRPFMHTGDGGLFKQRHRLGERLRCMSRHKLETLAQDALGRGEIVKCIAGGSKVPRVLDVPGGAYALGEGETVLGAAT